MAGSKRTRLRLRLRQRRRNPVPRLSQPQPRPQPLPWPPRSGTTIGRTATRTRSRRFFSTTPRTSRTSRTSGGSSAFYSLTLALRQGFRPPASVTPAFTKRPKMPQPVRLKVAQRYSLSASQPDAHIFAPAPGNSTGITAPQFTLKFTPEFNPILTPRLAPALTLRLNPALTP